ncbi:hypothetical protein Tsubulata_051182 [Turnera subulata]|uniref:Uncharacterized protein n=1 Tax=Turnera subulata TaxID=218843 RepID=A0A9Q0FJB6_9ROSI|nr:hypothetical protein Tsubulata_051182 [Turnera subulata]
MASFSFPSRQSKHVPYCNNNTILTYLVFFLVMSLLLGSGDASRPGVMIKNRPVEQPGSIRSSSSSSSENVEKPHDRKLYETGFLLNGHMFNFLPKGSPVPPSGPSKRHNSVQN